MHISSVSVSRSKPELQKSSAWKYNLTIWAPEDTKHHQSSLTAGRLCGPGLPYLYVPSSAYSWKNKHRVKEWSELRNERTVSEEHVHERSKQIITVMCQDAVGGCQGIAVLLIGWHGLLLRPCIPIGLIRLFYIFTFSIVRALHWKHKFHGFKK